MDDGIRFGWCGVINSADIHRQTVTQTHQPIRWLLEKFLRFLCFRQIRLDKMFNCGIACAHLSTNGSLIYPSNPARTYEHNVSVSIIIIITKYEKAMCYVQRQVHIIIVGAMCEIGIRSFINKFPFYTIMIYFTLMRKPHNDERAGWNEMEWMWMYLSTQHISREHPIFIRRKFIIFDLFANKSFPLLLVLWISFHYIIKRTTTIAITNDNWLEWYGMECMYNRIYEWWMNICFSPPLEMGTNKITIIWWVFIFHQLSFHLLHFAFLFFCTLATQEMHNQI